MDIASKMEGISLHISDDKLAAFIVINKRSDNIVVKARELKDYIESQGVVFGFMDDILKAIEENPKNFVGQKTLVAQGRTAADGKDGYIEYVYDLSKKDVTPLEMENGRVNYKELIAIHNVTRGQRIATKIPPERGITGTAVDGTTIPAKDGKDARILIGKNVVLDSEKENIYSLIDGVMSRQGNKVSVFPIYEVNGDVDYSVGNINFIGTVIVRGNIITGFRVVASGDIQVYGSVEGAELEAGGDIVVSHGILGQHKGYIKAGGMVSSSFIQDANVTAGTNVIVLQSILHSDVYAPHEIVCSGKKGLIVGGTLLAGHKIECRTLGNMMAQETHVEVGVQKELWDELRQLRERLRYLIAYKPKDKTEQHTIQERIMEIDHIFHEEASTARIICRGIIYPGSHIVMGKQTYVARDVIQNMYFKLIDGEITMIPNF
jgi:uncharacterized protein (DUF342 family)